MVEEASIKSEKYSYIHSSITLLLFFASLGVWWPFFQLWLTSKSNGLNLSGGQVGTIFSVNSLATLILVFLYGALQDKLDAKRHLLVFCAVIDSLIGPFFIWVYAPLLRKNFTLGMIVGSLVLSAGFISASGIFEAFTEKLSRRYDFEYGRARAWGSFGYAISSLFAGFLFPINPQLNFWVASLIGVLLLSKLLFCHRKKTTIEVNKSHVKTNPKFKDMLKLLKIRDLWVVIIVIMFTNTFHTIFDQQMFPEFFTKLFSNSGTAQHIYGILNSAQVFLEAVAMSLIPSVMKKIGEKKALLLAIGIMFFRIIVCAFIRNPMIVAFTRMMLAVEVPLFSLPLFRYFSAHFNPKLSASLYMIGFQVSSQVGQFLLSKPLGTILDQIGYTKTYFIIAMIVLIAGLFELFAFKKD